MSRRSLAAGVVVLVLLAGGLWIATTRGDTPAPDSGEAQLPLAYRELEFEPAPRLTPTEIVRLFEDDAYLVGFITRHGPEAATIAVRDGAAAAGITHCHDRAHEIGRLAYEIFGAQAFAFAGHSCKSGAMHGVTESLLSQRGTDNLAADVEVLCATVVREFFRHQCVHGVGHGLLGWVSYDLPAALDLCSLLAKEADRESCFSGVFMENISGSLAGGMVESEMDHAGMHHHESSPAVATGGPDPPPASTAQPTAVERNAQYLRPDDAHYPCNVMAEQYVSACYSVQTYHMLTVHDNDFAAVAEECTTLAAQLQETCFSSLGREVGNIFTGDASAAIATCQVVDLPYRLNCLEEVVQDWFWEESSAGVALDFCGRLSAFDEGVRCYWQIAWRASDLYRTPEEYRQFCGGFRGGYLWLCDFVLFQRLDQFGPQGRTDWIAATPAELRQIWEVCTREFEDAYCEITLFQQMESFHRSRLEPAVASP